MSSDTIRKWKPPDEEAVRYKINVSSKYLDLTKRKLELTRLPREVPLPATQSWKLGTPKSALEPLLDTWLDGYSWREQETIINDALPQFRTTIPLGDARMHDTVSLRIHFVHKRSSASDAIPLLYIHGYPGSFLEVSKILDPLTSMIPTHLANESASFHVIAPSIPGFGFSDAPRDEAFASRGTARCFDSLMKGLGYERYVVACSAQGWKIARWLVYDYESCVAVHTCIDGVDKLAEEEVHEVKEEKKAGWSMFKKPKQQSTANTSHVENKSAVLTQDRKDTISLPKPIFQPQTIAHGLCDSPVGLLASSLNQLYELGNLHLWTQGEVLNWTMLQWLPGPEAALRWVFATEQEEFESDETGNATAVGITSYQQRQELDESGLGISLGVSKNSGSPSALREDDVKIPITWSRTRTGTAGIPALDSPSDVIVDLREFCATGRREGWLRGLSLPRQDEDIEEMRGDIHRDEYEEAEKRTLSLMEVEDEVSRESHWWLLWRWISTNLNLRRGKHKHH